MSLKDLVSISYAAEIMWKELGYPSLKEEKHQEILKKATTQYKLLTTFEENKNIETGWVNLELDELATIINRWYPSKKVPLRGDRT